MNKKIIYFITESYKDNKVFFYNELKKLAEFYDIRFVSTAGEENVSCDIPNVGLFFYKSKVTKLRKLMYAFRYLIDKKCRREIKDILSSKGNTFFQLFRSVEYYAEALDFYKWFKKNIYEESSEKAIYYTYWCSYYAMAMAYHRQECPNIYRMITRLHEFDLYDESVDCGRQPFKGLINAEEDMLLFVSQLSLNYYANRHELFDSSKLILNRLGTIQNNRVTYNIDDEEFIMVSCSTVDSRKRVELIVDSLALLDFPIKWIHFGDGALFEKLKEHAHSSLDKKPNIKYEFMGRRSNEDILKYYSQNDIDLFVNVSSSEGCPVSIMEAMSYGIPIVATAVGEAELVISGNGLILDKNPTITDISASIKDLYDMKKERTNEYLKMREASYNIWKEMFDVEANINELKQYIDELMI